MTESPAKSTAMLIVAAGRGARAGADNGPKQYQMLGKHSVLFLAAKAGLEHDDIDHVQVVIHRDDSALYHEAMPDHTKLNPPVFGGTTRQASVRLGLLALQAANGGKPTHVLIHDAARPNLKADLISRLLLALDGQSAVLPAVPVADTLKRGNENGQVVDTVDRTELHAAQTPQGFEFEPILGAHERAFDLGLDHFTDDSALAEWAGMNVVLVEGARSNHKITTKEDILEAQAATPNVPDVRVGHGYDTHRLVPGDGVWLCGHWIEHNAALDGHSDADVGLHALTDALLSTIADGDIGDHFPPSDARWKGAKSDQFLAHAVERVQSAGGTITHLDVTLVCEAPKIGPHRHAMREAIARISGITVDRISVKATTNETIGFIGRKEGIVALATATVVMT